LETGSLRPRAGVARISAKNAEMPKWPEGLGRLLADRAACYFVHFWTKCAAVQRGVGGRRRQKTPTLNLRGRHLGRHQLAPWGSPPSTRGAWFVGGRRCVSVRIAWQGARQGELIVERAPVESQQLTALDQWLAEEMVALGWTEREATEFLELTNRPIPAARQRELEGRLNRVEEMVALGWTAAAAHEFVLRTSRPTRAKIGSRGVERRLSRLLLGRRGVRRGPRCRSAHPRRRRARACAQARAPDPARPRLASPRRGS